MNIAIIGSREFNDYPFLRDTISGLLNSDMRYDGKPVTIISGGAPGADTLAEKFATDYSFNFRLYPAEWGLYGKSAGFKRNRQIVENSDIIICYWNGTSRGTANSIKIARELKRPTFIFYF